MTVKFESKLHPEINPFLARLQKALENLPNNPKPECEGFYLANYDSKNDTLTNEKIGSVPSEKKSKYRHFASKKVTLTLLYKVARSKEIENGGFEETCPQGSFTFFAESEISCTGVSGHTSPIDEAISVLHELVKNLIRHHESSPRETETTDYVDSKVFYEELHFEAKKAQEICAPENGWISALAFIMADGQMRIVRD